MHDEPRLAQCVHNERHGRGGGSEGVWVTFSGGGSGRVFRSITSGSAWTDVSADLPRVAASRISLDPDCPATRVCGDGVSERSRRSGGSRAQSGAGLPRVVNKGV